MGPALAPAPADQAESKKAAAPLIPFSRAAFELLEPFHDQTHSLGSSSQGVSPIDVPATGYARGVLVWVTISGGVGSGTNAVADEDAPFNVLSDIAIRDTNGQALFGPVNGYHAYLKQKWLPNSEFMADARASVIFSDVDTGGNATFLIRLPAEIGNRDGLGALPNQNAASTYKVEYTVAAASTVYDTQPAPTLPSVRVRLILESWSQPSKTDARNRTQAIAPPKLGTTQFLRHETINVSAGDQTKRLSRMGNLIRGLIFVLRTAAGARTDANFPDQLRVTLDGRQLALIPKTVWQHYMSERTGYTGAIDAENGRDTGVFVLDFAHDFDGKIGSEFRDLWLPTSQGTRLEIEGDFGAAGVLSVLYNDVRAAGGDRA